MNGAALQAVLSSPRVRLVDCLTMARDAFRGRTSSRPLVGPGNFDGPDDPMSWKMARSTSAERSSDGRLSPLHLSNHPAMPVFPVAANLLMSVVLPRPLRAACPLCLSWVMVSLWCPSTLGRPAPAAAMSGTEVAAPAAAVAVIGMWLVRPNEYHNIWIWNHFGILSNLFPFSLLVSNNTCHHIY